MQCTVGKAYKTRFGWVALQERDVDAVERSLLEIPPDVAAAVAGTGAVMMAQGQLLDALRKWREEAARICRQKAGGGAARAGIIYANSCYRPLGTTAGSGKYQDPCGCIDSTDDFGHWSGFAIDVPTKFFRLSCVPALTIEEINLAAARAGLERPWYNGPPLTSYTKGYGEYWHYRVRP
ncbi:MAG: hypothetical protein PVH29_12305 [Candidatus Zixiibacteriota bacterium]|jgi:hypothetical protein